MIKRLKTKMLAIILLAALGIASLILGVGYSLTWNCVIAENSVIQPNTGFTLSGQTEDLEASLADGYALTMGMNVGDGFVSVGNGGATSVSADDSYARKRATVVNFVEPINAKEIKIMRFGMTKNISATAYFDFYANHSTVTVGDPTFVRHTAIISGAADTPVYFYIRTADYADAAGFVNSLVVVHEDDDRDGDYSGFSSRFYPVTLSGGEMILAPGEGFVITASNNIGVTFPSAVGPVTEGATGMQKYYVNNVNNQNGTVVEFMQAVNINDYNTAVIEVRLYGYNSVPRTLTFIENKAGNTLDDVACSAHTSNKYTEEKEDHNFVTVDLRKLADEDGFVESFILSMEGAAQENLSFYGVTLQNTDYSVDKTMARYKDFYLRDGDNSSLADKAFANYLVGVNGEDGTFDAQGFIPSLKMPRGFGTVIRFASTVYTDDYKSVSFEISKNTSDNVVFGIYKLNAEVPGDPIKTYTIGKSQNIPSVITIDISDIAINGACNGFILVHESDDRANDYADFSIRIYSMELTKPVSVKMQISLSEDITVRFVINEGRNTDIVFMVNGIVLEKIDGAYVYNEMTPQSLGDELIITVTGRNSYGEEVVLVDKTYTVKDYLTSLLEKTAQDLGYTQEKYDNMKQLVVDLLYYGKAAQDYTGYKTDEPVTEGIDETCTVFETPSYTREIENNTGDAVWYAATLRYSNKIQLIFKVKSSIKPDSILVQIGTGEVKEITQGKVADADKYEYAVDISLVDFDKSVTAQIKVNGEIIAPTLNYSVAAYIATRTEDESTDQIEKQLLERAYCYGVSAREFSNSDSE